MQKKILVAAVLTAVLLLFLEVGVTFLAKGGTFQGYALPPFGALTNPKQGRWLERIKIPPEERKEKLFRFDAHLGWSHRPSSESSDGMYTTNSIAARGQREYPDEPQAGITRIACFGDSFTMGTDVGDDDAYPAIFERLYEDHEAMNFGVGGYGVGQALLRFRGEGTELDAHVVAIGIMLENIGRNVNRYRPLWYPYSSSCGSKPRFRLDGDELELVPMPFDSEESLARAVRDGSVITSIAEHEYWLNRPTVPTGTLSTLVRVLYARRAVEERKPSRLWRDTAGEPFRVSVAILERFHHEALAAGARQAPVLIFPTREALAGLLTNDDRYWESLCQELERRGVPYIDLAEPLAELARSPEIGGDLTRLYTGKNHLNGRGNEVVARALFAWLGSAG